MNQHYSNGAMGVFINQLLLKNEMFSYYNVGESGVGCNIFVKYSYNSFNISDKIKLRILLNRHGSLQYMALFSHGKEFALGYIERKTCPNFVLQPAPGEGWL